MAGFEEKLASSVGIPRQARPLPASIGPNYSPARRILQKKTPLWARIALYGDLKLGNSVLIYGYVCSDRGELVNENPGIKATMLASATMQYSSAQTNLPTTSFTMPVRKGQYWTVRKTGGGGRYDVEVFFTTIEYARGP